MASDVIFLCDLSFRSLFLSEPKSSEYSLIHLPSLNPRVRKLKRNLFAQIRRTLGKRSFLRNHFPYTQSSYLNLLIPIAA